jgi:single-strand DNA-binding protein
MNKAILVGRLAKDPEFSTTKGGKDVATFSIATDESYKNKEGELIKQATFHNIVAYTSIGMIKYLHKGDQVIIEGSINNRSYEDKQGNKRYISEIILRSAEFGAKIDRAVERNKEEELPVIDEEEINLKDIPF